MRERNSSPLEGNGRSRHAAHETELVTRLERLNRELAEANEVLARRVAALERTALVDPLTGLGNRRRFEAALGAELRRAFRTGAPLTLLVCDVDAMRRFNERHGHAAGDALLAELGRAARRTCRRGGDQAMRYDGDELAVLLCGAGRAEASAFATRLLRETQSAPATLSVGGATFTGAGFCSPKLLAEQAHDALERARRAGGGCAHLVTFRER